MQIIIDMADDGTVTVEADGIPPSTYESKEDALEFVSGLLGQEEVPEEAEEDGGESDGMKSEDQAMWNQEAAARPANPNLMN